MRGVISLQTQSRNVRVGGSSRPRYQSYDFLRQTTIFRDSARSMIAQPQARGLLPAGALLERLRPRGILSALQASFLADFAELEGNRAVGANSIWHKISKNYLEPIDRYCAEQCVALIDEVQYRPNNKRNEK
jgi:hypothetical protein